METVRVIEQDRFSSRVMSGADSLLIEAQNTTSLDETRTIAKEAKLPISSSRIYDRREFRRGPSVSCSYARKSRCAVGCNAASVGLVGVSRVVNRGVRAPLGCKYPDRSGTERFS